MKKIILIFGACFSIIVLPYSLIFSFEAPKAVSSGMQFAGISFPEPVSLVFLGTAMFCLAKLGSKKIFKIARKLG